LFLVVLKLIKDLNLSSPSNSSSPLTPPLQSSKLARNSRGISKQLCDSIDYLKRGNAIALPEKKGLKTLVLDLDETLIHASFTHIPQEDFIVPVQTECRLLNISVLKRPGLDTFLKELSEVYELVLFTASTSRYANPIIDRIDPQHLISHRFYRHNCTFAGKGFIKDLSILNKHLKDVVIVDNLALSYALQPENALPVDTWIDDKKDKQLYNLIPILRHLAKVKDVRVYLKEIKKCKDHKSALKVIRSKLKDETIKTPLTELKQKNYTLTFQESLRASLDAAIGKSAALRTEIERLKSRMNIIESIPNNKAINKPNSKQKYQKNRTPKKKSKKTQELSIEKTNKPKQSLNTRIDNIQKSKEDLLAQLNYLKTHFSYTDFNSDKTKYKFILNSKEANNEQKDNHESKTQDTEYKEGKVGVSKLLNEKRPRTTPIGVQHEFSNPRRMPYKYMEGIGSTIDIMERLDAVYSSRELNKRYCHL
jgi:Dullard-like phosphatase family protein